MSSSASSDHATKSPGEASAPRRALNVRALVAGLGPAVMPMLIRDIARDGMSLEFEDHATAVDERWALHDAGVLVFFVSVIGGQRQRTSVFGRIRQRETHGLIVRLVGLEDGAVEALNYLLAHADARRALAKPKVAERSVSTETVKAACLAVIKQRTPALASAYIDGVVMHLQGFKTAAATPAEHKKFGSLLMELNAARARLEATMLSRAVFAFDSLFHHDPAAGAAAAEGSLSLVESIDLRSSLTVMEAIHTLSMRLRDAWAIGEPCLEKIALPKADLTAMAPGTLCHQVRDTIYFDDKVTRLRQVDLTVGFTAAFVVCVDALYADLNVVFAQHGVQAGADDSAWSRAD